MELAWADTEAGCQHGDGDAISGVRCLMGTT